MADRTVTVRLKANVGDFQRGMAAASASLALLRRNINDSNDHTAWLAGSLLALAPAAAPIGGVLIPAVMALTTQLGLAAAAGGTVALAFSGIGDALDALNEYQLDPTEAHLKKLNEEMKKIGPEGESFVKFLDEIGPKFNELRVAARQGMLPGVEEGLTSLLDRLPDLKDVVTEISEAMGTLAADAGEGIAGTEFDNFFQYLKEEASPILLDVGHAFGNFIDGLLEMGVAFGPLTEDFSQGMLEMSQRFEEWAEGLENSASFQEFVDFIRQATPEVLRLVGQISDTFVALVEAAAPVGMVMVPMLTALLAVVEGIARTPMGSILIAVTAFASLAGRLIAIKNLAGGGIIGSALTGQFTAAGRSADGLSKKMTALHGAAGLAGLGMFALSGATKDSQSGISDLAGVLGTAAIGFSVGGPWGAAVGGAIGLLMSFGDANTDQVDKVRALTNELRTQEGQITRTSIARKLADEGIFAAGSKVGADPKTITDAALGNRRAIAQIEAIGQRPGDFGGTVDQAGLLSAEGRAYDKLKTAIRETNQARLDALAAYAAEQQALGPTIVAVENLQNALVGIPPQVVTELRTLNFEPTKAQVVDIANRYGLVPAQVQTIIDQIGGAPTKEVVDGLLEVLADYDGSTSTATLDANPDPALSAIRRVMAAYNAMPRSLRDGFATGGAVGSKLATGGAVRGPGTGTSDSIPALLSNGEHVMTAAEVEKLGGQMAAYRMRAAIRSGALKFADGGAVYAHPRAYASGGAVHHSVSSEIGVSIRDLSFDVGRNLMSMRVVATDAAERVLADRMFETTFGPHA